MNETSAGTISIDPNPLGLLQDTGNVFPGRESNTHWIRWVGIAAAVVLAQVCACSVSTEQVAGLSSQPRQIRVTHAAAVPSNTSAASLK